MNQVGHSICGKGLVRISLLLAICLEVVPIEMNLIGLFWSYQAVLLVLVVKMTCLAAIFLPLVIYFALNGLTGLKWAKGRVTAVTIIVAINLALDIGMMCLIT